MRPVKALLMVIALAASCCLGVEARADGRVALVIGNSAYRHAPTLANPRNDATAVAGALERLGFTVLSGIDLDKAATEQTPREFGRAVAGADAALFYYAGHGLQVAGRNYIVPVDARLEDEADLPFEAVELSVVQALMERDPRTNLVFLGACRDNPLAQNLARSMGAARSTAVGRGLAIAEAALGTLVVFATQPGNVALDGQARHSPFSAALLDHLETPGIEIRQMLSRVRASVVAATQGKQVPWDHSSLVGDFFFVLAPGANITVAPRQEPPAASDREALFWQSVKDSRNPADFRSYLDQYPTGTFASLARNRLAEIEASQQVASPPQPPADIAVTEMDEAYRVRATANLRSGPSTSDSRIATLSPGRAITVTGKVGGKEWYRVTLDGGATGYVFGDLIEPQSARPSAAVQAATVVPERPADERYGSQYSLEVALD